MPAIVALRSVWRAIISSSSVGMTHAVARLPAALMHGPPRWLAPSSKLTPSHAASRQMRARIGAACSPIPAVNTMASRPAAARRRASRARGRRGRRRRRAPRPRAASRWRADRARPSSRPTARAVPTSCTGARCTSPSGHAALGHQVENHPGSIVPVRVPMGSPSRAVKPIVVATLRRPRIAHIEAPAPR